MIRFQSMPRLYRLSDFYASGRPIHENPTLSDMRSDFGNRLLQARKHAKLTQVELAKRVGMSQGTYAELEKNGNGSSYTPAIAEVCGVSTNWLAYNKGEMVAGNVAPAAVGDRRIPLISHVQAGNWSEATDPHAMGDGFDFLLTDHELSESAFALEIKGDSMLPEFKPGDRVIIDPAVHPQPGDFVVAKNGEEEATFKKYRPRGVNEFGGEVFELVPLNEDYATMRSDVQPIRIVGTMVEHRKYRRR